MSYLHLFLHMKKIQFATLIVLKYLLGIHGMQIKKAASGRFSVGQ